MSAPDATERTLLLRARARPADAPVVWLHSARRRGGQERRSTSPLAVLSRRFDGPCRSAVDPWEIAACLEAEGVSDRACEAYGYPDVFSLAAALFQLVPRRGATQRTELVREPLSTRRSLLRGLLYSLPGVAAVGAVTGSRPATAAVLLVALATGWGWNQAMAFLGHRRMGWEGKSSASALLSAGVAVGLVVVSLCVLATAWLTDAATASVLLAGALGWYLVAAGVLLVLGDEWWLFVALLPGTLAGGLTLVNPGLLPAAARYSLQGSSLAAVLMAVGVATRPQRRRGLGVPFSAVPSRHEVPTAVVHLLYGVLCATTVGLGPLTVATLAGHRPPAGPTAALPLVLSLGMVELQLGRLRLRMLRLLGALREPAQFAPAARLTFLRLLLSYLLVVGTVVAGCELVVRRGALPASAPSLLVVGYGVLAGCFFVALVLVALDRVIAPAAGLACALAGYLAVAIPRPTQAPIAYLGTFSLLFVALVAVALRRLTNPLVHL